MPPTLPTKSNKSQKWSLTRRDVVGASAGLFLGQNIIAHAQTATQQPLVATIVLDGKSYVYREDNGKDLGDFASDIGKFTQGCVRTNVTGCPLTVFFRPDRSSDRAEVVFELGRLFSGTPANLLAYDVTISRGDVVLASLKAPAHYWFSRWRWQSAPRPLVADIPALMTQGLLPPYDRSAITKSATSPVAKSEAKSAEVAAALGSAVLIPGQAASGQLMSMSPAEYLLEVRAGATYTVSIDSGLSNFLLLSIQDAANNWVAINFNGAALTRSASFTAEPSKTYRAVLQSFTDQFSPFTISFAGPPIAPVIPIVPPINPTPTTPTTPIVEPKPADDYAGDTTSKGVLAISGSVSGTLEVARDRDDFKLTLQANTSYTIICAAGTLALPQLSVRDSSGAVVAKSAADGSVPVTLTYKPAVAGTYWLAVESADNGVGTYTVTLADAARAQPVYQIMGLAGVTAYMPQTGERPDIGLVTGAQGDYLCTESASSLGLVRAQAEAAGTMPWHMRDENTNAPINFNTYPDATWYTPNRGWTPYITTTETPVTIDSAHQPALVYLPYLLTGDPYHLEDLQFQTNWNWGTLPPGFRPSIPQSRSLAWTLRSIAQSAKVTPKVVPDWLLPQSYWAGMLDTYGAYLEQNFINSPSPPRLRFRSTSDIDNNRADSGAPEATWIDPWQEDFLVAVMGWMLSMGFSQWKSAFEWKSGSTIARTSLNAGWDRAFATPYRVMLRPSRTSTFVESWSEALTLSQRVLKYGTATTDTWFDPDMTYLQYTLGALVYIDRLKTFDVAENLNWANKQFQLKPNWVVPNKWRLK